MESAKRSNARVYMFRFILFCIVVILLEAIGYLGLWLNSRGKDYLSNKHYFSIRAMLMGNTESELQPRYISLPYLGYVPNPNYSKYGFKQHNKDGYRGEWVPLKKNGKLRILCMGGSTTYGSGVINPNETYPAHLKVLLADYVKNDSVLSKIYTGVEVINAGVEAGNSAEELQQYLFKYRYYHADVVVLHTGVNDALLMDVNTENFQLDYTHRRRLNFHLEPLPQPAKFLMHSYFFSFFTVGVFYNDFSSQQDEFFQKDSDLFVKWSDINIDSVFQKRQLEFYPFYTNTKSLSAEIAADSSSLLLLPNALNIHSSMVQSGNKYTKANTFNDSLLKQISYEENATYIPFVFSSITNPADWIDDCHLNSAGEKQKAELVFIYVKQVLHNKLRN